ncbi:unnamed protein product [Aphanomyces euteiches]|nr:hypothetical protein Ae201684P_019863 [Aphanomyces euteiches]KAH9136968.1 hypothetical protein AeRB84_018080 [Aphanomyces euteiches]
MTTLRSTTCAVCCKCVDVATQMCHDCDLSYCSDCSSHRHSKGSFQRHVITPIHDAMDSSSRIEKSSAIIACDECGQVDATSTCLACELVYCHVCLEEVHRNGKLQSHIDNRCIQRMSNNQEEDAQSDLNTFEAWKTSDLWGSWNVFGERPTSQTSNHSWTNPAYDDSSSSSDDEPKASSFSSAFKSLALTHSVDPSFDFPSPVAATMTTAPAAWTRSVSQNELEDLFTALEMSRASRHVVVRSISRHLSSSEVSNISHIMHSFGEIAQYIPAFALHGLLVYSYFDLPAAVHAVQHYQTIRRDDPNSLSVAFCVAYEPPAMHNHAVVAVEVHAPLDSLPTTDEMIQFCTRFGSIARVTQAEYACAVFMVELSDTRDVGQAIVQLNRAKFGGQFSLSAQLAPLPLHVQKLVQSFRHAMDTQSQHSSLSFEPNLSSMSFHQPASDGFQPLFRRESAMATPPTTTAPPSSQESAFSLVLDRVSKGLDRRTTLMIRNIPNKYTQSMLLAEINENHQDDYDFFYLPIDFKNKCNMGYAFINFVTYDAIVPFYQAFNGQKWRNFNSEKVCAITYARLQGKAAMVARFQNSSVLEKHESYRPLVFKSSGPDKGMLEPFPAPRIVKPRAYVSPDHQDQPASMPFYHPSATTYNGGLDPRLYQEQHRAYHQGYVQPSKKPVLRA